MCARQNLASWAPAALAVGKEGSLRGPSSATRPASHGRCHRRPRQWVCGYRCSSSRDTAALGVILEGAFERVVDAARKRPSEGARTEPALAARQHEGSRGRRRQSRWNVGRGRGFEELLGRSLVFGGLKEALAEEMLRPEGKKELETSPVHRTGGCIPGIRSGGRRRRGPGPTQCWCDTPGCRQAAACMPLPPQVRPRRRSGRHSGRGRRGPPTTNCPRWYC